MCCRNFAELLSNFWSFCRTFTNFATFAKLLELLPKFCRMFAELLQNFWNFCRSFVVLQNFWNFCRTFAIFAELLQGLQNFWKLWKLWELWELWKLWKLWKLWELSNIHNWIDQKMWKRTKLCIKSDKLDMALIILLIILLIKNDFYWCILKFPTSLSNLAGITRLLDFKQIVFICLFLTEQAWSHGGLRTRELGQDPSHVSMGD